MYKANKILRFLEDQDEVLMGEYRIVYNPISEGFTMENTMNEEEMREFDSLDDLVRALRGKLESFLSQYDK
jgi:hypothetical protein